MRADNTAHLTRSARARTDQSRHRATEAIRRLDRDGHHVTVVAVSRLGGVSRSFIYRHHDLRAEIDRLRHSQPAANRRLPSQPAKTPNGPASTRYESRSNDSPTKTVGYANKPRHSSANDERHHANTDEMSNGNHAESRAAAQHAQRPPASPPTINIG